MAKDKSVSPAPTEFVLSESMKACVSNGNRLIDDAYAVEFQEPPATKLMLSVIAQEEFAKAFVLFLVREKVIDWNRFILRAMNDHACKQLVGVIIEYIDPQLETMEEMKQWAFQEAELGDQLPEYVASAIVILRHEKIGKWESTNWDWVETPVYDPSILQIAEGKRDRLKQDALYVRLGKDARILSSPIEVAEAKIKEEFKRAEDYRFFVTQLLTEEPHSSSTYRKVCAVLKQLFQSGHSASENTLF